MSMLLRGRMSDVPIILTRWVLVIAISYAIIFSADGRVPFWPHQVFIAAILGSNLLFAWVLARGKSWSMLSSWATGLDIAAVSMAISVAGNVSAEFYLVYFAVLILAAVVNQRHLLVGLALIACACYTILLWADIGNEVWRDPALLVRLPVLFGVALYFGTAVQQARREHQRQAEQLTIERGKALSALTEMGNVALSGGYPGPVLYELAGWVQEIVEFDRCSLLIFADGGKRGYLAASGDDPSIEVRALEIGDYPELVPVLERGEFIEVHPDDPAELWEEISEHLPEGSPFKTFIVVPIKRAEEVIGAFYLRDGDPARRLGEAQTAFCFQAAQMAAAFIFEHDLLARLQERTRKDTLTGLMNYQAFIEAAEKLVAGGVADGPVSMAVVNIDNLREINQRWGHNAGNDVIAGVGKRLRSGIGAEAAVCRYGGDEFIALLPAGAAETEARLQAAFLDRLGEAKGELPAEPHASVGIASSPEDGDNPEALLAAAQKAMRTAKSAGGHRIHVSGSS
jgi:diguanylate cyclase (GGDEF)-like protein